MQLTHQEGLANYVEINHDIQKHQKILIALRLINVVSEFLFIFFF